MSENTEIFDGSMRMFQYLNLTARTYHPQKDGKCVHVSATRVFGVGGFNWCAFLEYRP